MYETYIFKKPVMENIKCKEITANVVKGESVNLSIEFKMNKKEMLELICRYKILFFPDYTLAKCKKEFGREQFPFTEGISPSLSRDRQTR